MSAGARERGPPRRGRRAERRLRIDFDGSRLAKVTGNEGEAFEVEMVCNDDEL